MTDMTMPSIPSLMLQLGLETERMPATKKHLQVQPVAVYNLGALRRRTPELA